jgi:hypothetical protein
LDDRIRGSEVEVVEAVIEVVGVIFEQGFLEGIRVEVAPCKEGFDLGAFALEASGMVVGVASGLSTALGCGHRSTNL